MSELRDITSALRSFENRLEGIEECLLVLMRDSQQQTEWRHEERNRVQLDIGRKVELDQHIKQIEEFQGALWKYLADLDERFTILAAVRHDDVKHLSDRVRKLEPSDEVTKA